jgi:two-component system invasion response regulator UvrY
VTARVSVLVVDDNDAYLCAAIAVVQASDGFELVGTATTGEEAVALAATTTPDLVLMDVRMPGIGGFEAARQIQEAQPATVIALITAEAGVTPGDTACAVIDKRDLTPGALSEIWRVHASRAPLS